MFQWLWAVLRLPWLMQEGDPPRPDPVLPENVVKLQTKATRKRTPRPAKDAQ